MIEMEMAFVLIANTFLVMKDCMIYLPCPMVDYVLVVGQKSKNMKIQQNK